MNDIFTKSFHVRWNEADANGHMRNTAYLDLATDIRMTYFQENNFTANDFDRLRVGPVVMKDEIQYFREMKLMDPLEITLELAGMASDGSRFIVRNCYFRQDGKITVTIDSTVGWLNLDRRRLIIPPEPLFELLKKIAKTDDFVELPSSIKS